MSTSSAGVFRHRQSVADLVASMRNIGLDAIGRLATTEDARRALVQQVAGAPRFSFPVHRNCYSDVLLAAAMPDEDFPAFMLATCMLLADRLLGGDGPDDLFWNWDAFAKHYLLADPPIRAAILNGFRAAETFGLVSLHIPVPEPGCYTRPPDDVLHHLESIQWRDLALAIRGDISAEEAGHLWTQRQGAVSGWIEMSAFRCLYERPQSISPSRPGEASLIAWN